MKRYQCKICKDYFGMRKDIRKDIINKNGIKSIKDDKTQYNKNNNNTSYKSPISQEMRGIEI